MDTVSAEKFLLDQIPLSQRQMVAPTLKSAYGAAKLLAAQEAILQVQSASDNHGRVITWAVDHAFEKLLKSGQWPFDHRWRDFDQPTGKYLEIRMSHSVMSISQVARPGKQPRNVCFRENGRFKNEPFFDLREFDDTRSVHGLPHFLLIHGHQDLNFAHLAVPHSLHRRDWIYKTPNLLTMIHAVNDDLPPPEQTDFDAAMELKQEIDKWRRDNGL